MPLLFPNERQTPTPLHLQGTGGRQLLPEGKCHSWVQGRHDPAAIIHRARVVVDSVSALVIM